MSEEGSAQEVVLLDTSALSVLLPERPHKVAKELRSGLAGKQPVLSFVTLGEIWALAGGYRKGAQPWGEARRARLAEYLRSFPVLPYSGDVALEWARVRVKTNQSGQVMADNDAWIAASAIHYGIPLATLDRDFLREALEELTVLLYESPSDF